MPCPVLLLLALGLGCAQPELEVAPTPKAPARTRNTAIPVLSQAPSDRRYDELAILTASPGEPGALIPDLGTMLPGLMDWARQLGADAIILKGADRGLAPGNTANVYAVAIRCRR